MDVVIALSLEWIDPRLSWSLTVEDTYVNPVRQIRIDSSEIWTPNIDLANRIYNYSPERETNLKATIGYKGNKSNIPRTRHRLGLVTLPGISLRSKPLSNILICLLLMP